MALARRAWQWLQQRQRQAQSRRLRLCETVSLGEKRFLAIVNVDGKQFLVGGAAGSVALLTELAGASNFANVLQKKQRGRRATA
jgi:flagellar biogenesis protein FliO